MEVIDSYCHFIPQEYLRFVTDNIAHESYMFEQVSRIPTVTSLECRLEQISRIPDYRQILSLVGPTAENLVAADKVCQAIEIANNGLAELVRENPTVFGGFVANVPLLKTDEMLSVAERSVTQLGALGVQITTSIQGRPIDGPEFFELYALAEEMGFPVWLHPVGTQSSAEYEAEEFSKYELWWALGWPYQTSIAMARLVFAGVFAEYPDVRIITHHAGAMIPMIAGRICNGMRIPGKRTPPNLHRELIDSVVEEPLEHFRKFYVDTATFAWTPALECALTFFDVDHVLFASDAPFGPDGGNTLIEQGIEGVTELNLSDTERSGILAQNINRVIHRMTK